jgi:hypothetical protein
MLMMTHEHQKQQHRLFLEVVHIFFIEDSDDDKEEVQTQDDRVIDESTQNFGRNYNVFLKKKKKKIY